MKNNIVGFVVYILYLLELLLKLPFYWKDEQALKIQDLKFQLSQERQNNLINERFNRLGNCGCGWNNNCGCGNGCGC